MAVYFQPARDPWYKGPLELLASSLIGGMMQRDSAARDYKYKTRLAEDEAARNTAEAERQQAVKNGYLDQVMRGVNANGNQLPGTADFLAGAIGSGADLQKLQAYWLPQMLTVDQGNQKTVAPAWQNGTVGDGRSYQMGMSPQAAGTLDIARQKMALEQWEAQQQAAYRNRALGISAGNANRPNLTFANGMTDANGNPVMIDRKTGRVVPLTGVKMAQGGNDALDTILKKAQIVNAFYPPLKGGGQTDYVNMDINGTGGATGQASAYGQQREAMIKALLSGDTQVPVLGGSGGAGAGGKSITTDEIEKIANAKGINIGKAIRDAKALGYTVIQSKH